MGDEVPELDFKKASMESKGGMVPVRLKLTAEGVAFKSAKAGTVEMLPPADLELINWQRLAGGYGVRIFTSNGSLYRFGGFKESDKSKLEKYFKNNYKKTMVDKEYSLKGWNYGAVNFHGDSLSFDVSNHPAFEIPLNNVSQCVGGKNEVTMEFHQHDETPVALVELRFHLPPTELAGDDHVETFKERVMQKAQVIAVVGEALAIFDQVYCTTPRGRYDMKFYPTFIQLHGKTFDFKIPVENVLRLFLLPHMDARQHYFVVAVDPPIKQGQTRYPYLILQFSDEDEIDIELPISDDELKEKYEGRLEKEMSGPQFEIISRMFKGVCSKKIVTPNKFVGHSGSPAIGCSYKAASGYIYPLERGFFFIHKPPLHIRFDEIDEINFARSGSTTRSFDIEIKLKDKGVMTFSTVDKGEYNKLHTYCTEKKLKVKSKGVQGFSTSKKRGGDDDNAPDHYMNRVKAEADERSDDDDDDDSESEDSDFAPGQEASDVAEEFDSNASDSSDADASGGASDGGTPKKKKEKKEAKPRKARTVSERPRKSPGAKRAKDVNAPKRPMSAYIFFINEHREQIKSDNPGIAITDISRKAGEMWGKVTDKKKWEEMNAKAKEVYEKAMEEYKASGKMGEYQEKLKESKKAAKASQPKKASAPRKAPAGPRKAPSGSPTKSSASGFKSKEFIEFSSSSEADSGDEDEKPLKEVQQKKEAKKKLDKKNEKTEVTEEETKSPAKKSKKEESEADDEIEASEEEEEKPKPKGKKGTSPKKKAKKEESEEDEEIEESEEEEKKPKGKKGTSPKKKAKKEESEDEGSMSDGDSEGDDEVSEMSEKEGSD